MSVDVRITWNQREFDKITHGDVPRAVERAAGRTRDRAKAYITRVDTGALRQSIMSWKLRATNTQVWWAVGSQLPYALYQHEGTHGPILPRRAKVLRFRPKGSNAYVFARQVRGVTGEPFLTDPLKKLSVEDFV